MHFCGDDGAGEDTAADGDHSGEGAFFVCDDDCMWLAKFVKMTIR